LSQQRAESRQGMRRRELGRERQRELFVFRLRVSQPLARRLEAEILNL